MSEESIGQRLRRYRKLCGKTLVQVSKEAGVSAGFLSQAERDMTGLSLSSLANIAKSLGVSSSELFPLPRQEAPDSHQNTRQSYALTSMMQRYERLSTSFDGSVLNAVKLILPIDYRSEEVSHEGDEFVYVLNGKVRYIVGNNKYDLVSGDSLHFNPKERHAIHNNSGEVCEIISVSTQPLFENAK